MLFTTAYRQGDIVLVPFPFTDLTSAKRRPALVVSPDSFNQHSQHLILLAVTSHLSGDENIIALQESDFLEGAPEEVAGQAHQDVYDSLLFGPQANLHTEAGQGRGNPRANARLLFLGFLFYYGCQASSQPLAGALHQEGTRSRSSRCGRPRYLERAGRQLLSQRLQTRRGVLWSTI